MDLERWLTHFFQGNLNPNPIFGELGLNNKISPQENSAQIHLKSLSGDSSLLKNPKKSCHVESQFL